MMRAAVAAHMGGHLAIVPDVTLYRENLVDKYLLKRLAMYMYYP